MILCAAGLTLLLLNVTVVATVATGAVPGAVDEMFATYPKDEVCADDACSVVNDNWASSTSERDYYAWNLANLEEILADPTTQSVYEQVGPVTYEITAERTLLAHDPQAGTLTYSEIKTYEWQSGTPSDTPITALNILYEPQRIGATSLFIEVLGQMTRAGFCSAMIDNDMENGVPSQRTATDLATEGPLFVNGSLLHDWSSHAVYNATDPGDSSVAISLTSKWGPALFVGLGSPAASVAELAAAGSVHPTMKRAGLFGYLSMANETAPDLNQTLARDQILYGAVAPLFAANGGGDTTWDDDIDEVEDRFFEVSGARITNHDVLNDLLYGMDGDTPRGLLVSDADGVIQGLALLLSAAQENPFSVLVDYGVGLTDLIKIGDYAGGWFLDETFFPLILNGGSGTLNASAFEYSMFGAEDPMLGGYADAGLNLGGIWGSGMMAGHGATGPVSLTYSEVEEILFGPAALTGDGAVPFLYGEVTGHTLPLDAETMLPAAGGVEMDWNNALVSDIYGIDENAAAALRYFVSDLMFADQIPSLLEGMFGVEATGYPGATKYVTHTVDEWLFGWRDPLMAQLGGDVDNLTLGWQSLETNKTFFGSVSENAPHGVSTGDGTSYTICTGENPSCDKGEVLSQDGSEYLFWRDPEMEAGTYGALPAESLSGTTGGFITGQGDQVNLGDYAVVQPSQQADGDHLGMPVEVWSVTLAPGERSIQAKLTGQNSAIDIFPGAVPIYFSADVELKVESTARIIVAGESASRFHLDTRLMHEQAASPPTEDDLQTIFMIESGGGADQETVDQMQSGIIDNQKRFTYWTNFDTGSSAFFIDQITLFIYLAGIALLVVGLTGLGRGGTPPLGVASESEQ